MKGASKGMRTSRALGVLAVLGLGIAGGVTLMRARRHVLPEFRDHVAGNVWLPHFDWYTPQGKRLLRRGFLLQAAAALMLLLLNAT